MSCNFEEDVSALYNEVVSLYDKADELEKRLKWLECENDYRIAEINALNRDMVCIIKFLHSKFGVEDVHKRR